MTTRILACGTDSWRHYCVIRDNAVTIVDMVPALWGGWNVRGISYQGNDDWCGMTSDRIVAFKNESSPGHYRAVDPSSHEGTTVLRLEIEKAVR